MREKWWKRVLESDISSLPREAYLVRNALRGVEGWLSDGLEVIFPPSEWYEHRELPRSVIALSTLVVTDEDGLRRGVRSGKLTLARGFELEILLTHPVFEDNSPEGDFEGGSLIKVCPSFIGIMRGRRSTEEEAYGVIGVDAIPITEETEGVQRDSSGLLIIRTSLLLWGSATGSGYSDASWTNDRFFWPLVRTQGQQEIEKEEDVVGERRGRRSRDKARMLTVKKALEVGHSTMRAIGGLARRSDLSPEEEVFLRNFNNLVEAFENTLESHAT